MSATLMGSRAPKGTRYIAIILMVWSIALILMTVVLKNSETVTHQFHSAAEIAEMHATTAMLTHVHQFRVACPDPGISAADRARWDTYAAQKGWAPYPEAGAGCVDP